MHGIPQVSLESKARAEKERVCSCKPIVFFGANPGQKQEKCTNIESKDSNITSQEYHEQGLSRARNIASKEYHKQGILQAKNIAALAMRSTLVKKRNIF